MKIAFFSAVSFGALGSPGTYKFIEKCQDSFDLIAFAPPGGEKTVFSSSTIPLVPVKNLNSDESIETMIQCLGFFNPDIIYIFNFPGWHGLLMSLKKVFPDKKYILDIKSPLLADGQKRKEIQKNGESAHVNLDAIVTLSEHNVPTWIPNCTIKPMVYPLGIDLSSFNNLSVLNRKKCFKFIYIGVLHAKRQLELLIETFSKFLMKTDQEVCLDLYGTGPDHERLQTIASFLPKGNCIKFHGLYPQKELIHILPTYDAGIAWVPCDEYDTSPSLKAIEYMAAGLPILASDTKAHRLLEKEGCSIDFFENTSSSLVKVLLKTYESGFTIQRIQQNSGVVKIFDYTRIIHDYFCPFFENITENTFKQNKNSTKTGTIKKTHRILFIGPLGFRPGVWETRVSYIFPDLFEAVPEQFEIYVLTETVPEFARNSLEMFCRRYGITHTEVRSTSKNLTISEYWKTEISFAANEIRPDVITNIFAPATLGTAMGLAGRETGARVILRVAGDQIGARIPMGFYHERLENFDVDMADQTLGIQMADTIIVMSPLEKERVCKELPTSQWKKVLVCIRGIDVARFSKIEEQRYQSTQVNSFLFVGRKSLEKGYDILEDVADITLSSNNRIQFNFAGSFEVSKIKNRNYIGWIDNNDLQKTFFESDAFIMTSRIEGFPQVAAEAMATGLPCILPKHLFESILENGKHALLTSLDAREISKVVLQLNENKEMAAALSVEARKFAENKLDKTIWFKIYHDILMGEEKGINDPFSQLKTKNNKKGSGKSNKAFLKMVLLVSPSILSVGKTRHKINRFIIEMVKRNHLLYLMFPADEILSFITSEKIVFLPYRSFQMAKGQVEALAPDLLIIAADHKDRLKYSLLVHGTDIPLVMLELLYSHGGNDRQEDQNSLDIALAVWEEEMVLSFAALVLTIQKRDINYLSDSIRKRIVFYPQIVFQNDKRQEAALKPGDEMDFPVLFPIKHLTLRRWEDLNNRMYDYIETALLNASKYKKEAKKTEDEDIGFDSEKLMHILRMRQKVVQNINIVR